MRLETPYHEGELLVQQRTGQEMQAMRIAGVISDRLRPGSIAFLAQQSMVVLGSVDSDRTPWASILFGPPGFITAPDDRTVQLELSSVGHDEDDPFWENIEADPRIGMLAIEFTTRRRLRINGDLRRTGPETLRVDVLEAYPNCPKYIQRREMSVRPFVKSEGQSRTSRGDVLTPGLRATITRSDTFFVASGHPLRGVDVSHRGGHPGFVEVLDERTLRVPDYVGNGLYNTLGNFVSHPRAGLLFIDYDAGTTLQLIGVPKIRWELDAADDRTGGTRRYWDFTVERWLVREIPQRVDWVFLDYSPFNPTSVQNRTDKNQEMES